MVSNTARMSRVCLRRKAGVGEKKANVLFHTNSPNILVLFVRIRTLYPQILYFHSEQKERRLLTILPHICLFSGDNARFFCHESSYASLNELCTGIASIHVI